MKLYRVNEKIIKAKSVEDALFSYKKSVKDWLGDPAAHEYWYTYEDFWEDLHRNGIQLNEAQTKYIESEIEPKMDNYDNEIRIWYNLDDDGEYGWAEVKKITDATGKDITNLFDRVFMDEIFVGNRLDDMFQMAYEESEAFAEDLAEHEYKESRW